MNTALDKALRDKGITTYRDRVRFALSIPMSEKTLRRWVQDGGTNHNEAIARAVARRLAVKYEDLWPKESVS